MFVWLFGTFADWNCLCVIGCSCLRLVVFVDNDLIWVGIWFVLLVCGLIIWCNCFELWVGLMLLIWFGG